MVVAPYGTQFTISYQGNGGNSVILTSLGNVPLTAQLAFAVPSLAVDEKAGVATVEVVRTGGYQGPVSVVATTSGGTAVAGVNYTPVDLDLSFAAGQDSQTLTIPINAAVALTSAVTVTIVLSSPGGVAVLGSPSTMTLVIQNGNQPPPSSPRHGGEREPDHEQAAQGDRDHRSVSAAAWRSARPGARRPTGWPRPERGARSRPRAPGRSSCDRPSTTGRATP